MLKEETEILIIATPDQAIPTNYSSNKILKKPKRNTYKDILNSAANYTTGYSRTTKKEVRKHGKHDHKPCEILLNHQVTILWEKQMYRLTQSCK